MLNIYGICTSQALPLQLRSKPYIYWKNLKESFLMVYNFSAKDYEVMNFMHNSRVNVEVLP